MEIEVLRPWGFLFLLPAVLFCFFRFRAVQAWLGVIDTHLLDKLLVKTSVRLKKRLSVLLAVSGAFLLTFALAGVSFKKTKAPLYHPASPAVIVLDMSLSMKAKDVSPNRFSRAVFKVYDLLDELKGIPVSLIVFTDEPYLLIPSTTDKNVIETVLPLLSFSLMPSQGSRTDRAIAEALRSIRETGASFGDIFLITDGGNEAYEIQDRTDELVRFAASQGTRLFILGVGTPQGGRLLEKEDVPVLDALGNPVVHRLQEDYLKRLSVLGAGQYVRVRTDNSDVDMLVKNVLNRWFATKKSDIGDSSATDGGYWFLIVPLMMFPFLFRKGRFFIIAGLMLFSFPAKADIWNYFLSPSGNAMRRLDLNEPEKAIETALQSGNFKALYNVGTRLIFLQKYPEAIELLEKAVSLRPNDENAQINLEIARRLNENPPDNDSSNSSNDDQSEEEQNA